ncbi:carbonic anhydrase family protein [Roseiconus lacunae]|uniref:Carbonic anhydrase n=1 Tax=Roseiconus lacunae TaxID=2605694 RepID=A0ABT7PST2_9BACT|nr:carbonic anhydrase family protein [Roseiconus lacunae]MDM4019339.1 carbonic anhydrase family protein [Roseiconus lacunae]
MEQQQSPINIKKAIQSSFPDPLRIHWKKTLKGKIKIDPDTHKSKVVFNGDKRQKIAFDGREFQIEQFHFHFESEHWIEGKQFPMELHIVHREVNSETLKLGVLGVMIEAGRGDVPKLIQTLMAFQADETCDVEAISTNPWDWIPRNSKGAPDIARYYRYEGSLTTPEYDEVVSWIVLDRPLKLPQKEIDNLITCVGEPARLPQPLYRRFVLKTFDN